MKNIALIGCTGSIGRQAIKVAARYPEKFRIVAMAANTGGEVFVRQAAEVCPAFAALRQEGEAVPVPAGTRFARGESAFEEACSYADADVVLVAVTGFAGLKAALLAIAAGKDIALANKESLVAGGDLVMRLAAEKGVNVLPVDSEHSAVWQCLHFDRKAPFSRILLTASGGALRDVPLAELSSVTAAQALAHPNWDMGAKITIDCATMLNKGFEVIEAMHLYGAALSQIKVLIHRESVVHSLVEFADGAALAQLGVPSMELPIQLALTYPERLPCCPPADLAAVGALHFSEVERGRYPCFFLALGCAEKGGAYPCILNAAGEVAVGAFLKGQIKYTQIAEIIEGALCAGELPYGSYAALEEADAAARARARTLLPGA
ncbi:MAG TPA: 1-deoxy-D-xylulose-5-phosphate reductoisomerase [Candidatus Borkfalkia avicola]|uniref:1-deoxy-D-xylulose 5-phosphate reductoisomerase n=1 Tax=Candidatus Borkfalkia avicola TaxID=2838503 RepID=A0A9D2II68_9FIRM|nr:1-deoxy-D-xylulose-5-phosphate reductoisomerase [Candidatus Borkfalkia avicola]